MPARSPWKRREQHERRLYLGRLCLVDEAKKTSAAPDLPERCDFSGIDAGIDERSVPNPKLSEKKCAR